MTPRTPRRRHRVVIPVVLGALVLTVTLVSREIDQPDQTDRGFLSPVSTGDDGGSRLAASLTSNGVLVQRETDTVRALRATRGAPATLFVPAPELLHPRTVDALGLLPAGTRLVLVDPPRRVLDAAGLPLRPTARRWATRAVAPHHEGRPCPLPEMTGVGAAAVTRARYAPTGAVEPVELCFAAGLARLRGHSESLVVGASDPFRNSRIDEWGNRAFATRLLAGTGRVVWLNLDGPAPPPPEPPPGPASPPPDRTDSGYGEHDHPDAGTGHGEENAPGDRSGQDASGPARSGQDDSTNPLWSAFPPWFWALLLQLLLAALLVGAGRARRLGPPTPEPLPVTVPAAETVRGRAHLYQRAQARESAAETLRAAARARLARRLHLSADTEREGLTAAVATRTGTPRETVDRLLHGAAPATDQELLDLATGLDRAASADGPAEPRPSPPVPQPRSEGDHR
ncbi:DUF4350 domain-containing protein [Micromonospora craniellae]|uniref:DUF4350 domain-containing protein n=1 Tax=Micromonospora craniellae TaxID=2294034 RepID=UPI00168BA606|nr:DUF4350 domain-containing protein [Micromonospora craniellae]QOC93551.1 DUF4350 domain-containing protein [Micromonospora craniellae]